VKKIIECVPNFSEGRRRDVVDLLGKALTSAPGVVLLDSEMDSAHNRCVISVAGEPEAVATGVVTAVGKAIETIDLRKHQGEHPRMGAADVIPFIPISGLTMEEAVELSIEVAREIAERCNIPVYLYEQSARVPARRDLAHIRKGEFEGIRDEIRTNSERKPDFGPMEVHPSAGALAVGARFPLIAYNIYLNTDDVKIAQAIAQAVRFAGGGLRFVKALGFEIKERNQVQVSMNLTNHLSTPIFRAFEMVEMEAKRYGVSIASSEIVGLVPQKALDVCAGHYLRLEKFASSQILENRLAQTMLNGPLLGEFIAEVALPGAVPGGGSVAALAGALAAALGEMVSRLTENCKADLALSSQVKEAHVRLLEARRSLYDLIEEDSAAYQALIDAMKFPRETGNDLELRAGAVERAARGATEVPLATARTTYAVLECLAQLLRTGNTKARPDAAAGIQLAYAALKGAQYSILANIPLLKDAIFAESCRTEVSHLVESAQSLIVQADQLAMAVDFGRAK